MCRIDGVIREEGTPGWVRPPGELVYDLGYDNVGECYYRRTGPWAGWIVLGANGTQLLFGWDLDGVPGGPFVGDVWVEQCVSEPVPGEPPWIQVYNILATFEFAEPDPALVPAGIGLAGASTQLYVDPPERFTASVVSPVSGSTIDVEIWVPIVAIAWGDGAEASIPESDFDLFRPYPDGLVNHVWEESDNLDMSVGFQWAVRWRRDGGAWQFIDMPDTTWTEPYRVDEVVGRRSG